MTRVLVDHGVESLSVRHEAAESVCRSARQPGERSVTSVPETDTLMQTRHCEEGRVTSGQLLTPGENVRMRKLA